MLLKLFTLIQIQNYLVYFLKEYSQVFKNVKIIAKNLRSFDQIFANIKQSNCKALEQIFDKVWTNNFIELRSNLQKIEYKSLDLTKYKNFAHIYYYSK